VGEGGSEGGGGGGRGEATGGQDFWGTGKQGAIRSRSMGGSHASDEDAGACALGGPVAQGVGHRSPAAAVFGRR
jgi:hypothetical protein